jgi:hypothetical protein
MAKPKTLQKPQALKWALPAGMDIPPDPIMLSLNFHEQAVVLKTYGETNTVKIVSANDVAHALSEELGYSTGLLPASALWWKNTAAGPITAIYEPPRVRRLAVDQYSKEPRRYDIPLPGLVFLCHSAKAPAVYAVKARPKLLSDVVYHAPFPNVYAKGTTCPGNHRYPADPGEIVEDFFRSFFSGEISSNPRSHKFQSDMTKLWTSLEGKKEYPLDDLVRLGTLKDIEGGNVFDDK